MDYFFCPSSTEWLNEVFYNEVCLKLFLVVLVLKRLFNGNTPKVLLYLSYLEMRKNLY